MIGLLADQAPTGLYQLDRSIRHADTHEGVATTALDPLGQRRSDRIIGDGKRQPGNYHMGKIVAGQINTLGKARQAKNYTALAGIHLGSMAFDQLTLG